MVSAVFELSGGVVGEGVEPPALLPTPTLPQLMSVPRDWGSAVQGGHSPDHMKFPDFSLTFPVQAGKNY